METQEELQKWTGSLSAAEKRFITLLGKARAGANDSQQLELFDWLNQAKDNEHFPLKARFLQNLPTVSNRLKDLILDGLRLLHKEATIDAQLRTMLDELAILHQKKLALAAKRQLKRGKKLALDSCRYAFALQFIEWEQKIAASAIVNDASDTLKRLRKEEIQAFQKLAELRDLQNRHDLLLELIRQFPYHRDAEVLVKIRTLTESEIVNRLCEEGGYLEQALAVNLLGIRDLYERKASVALLRYQKLLKSWETHYDWQIDQAQLLLLICKFYQSSCFYSPVDMEEAKMYIMMADRFKGLSTDVGRDFQRMLFHNQFALALNTGKFDVVKKLIGEIDNWLATESKHLTEAQQLSFLCNFSISEFLSENFAGANKFVTRILNMPNRNARKDIREFALVLQVVLQFELENLTLNEYLTRAGKRRSSKNISEHNFERLVFKHLDFVIRAESEAEIKKSLKQLISDLDELARQMTDTVPLLGLKEIQIWAQSRETGTSLTEIFLQEVKKNLDALSQAKKIKV